MSAVVASQLLDEWGWTEGELGGVQASFFAGYTLSQVLGGLLGSGRNRRRRRGGGGGGGEEREEGEEEGGGWSVDRRR
jgi:hypothetical protein